ncbi:proton-conducting transporter transmembrane domain-containing protein [Rhodopirellula sp. P2]|uniref:proton-conducting transporter transmembrane domain-containing protein n=1 Tax=Rhodopirellula sp. P2 TaxID=2127060 RepID=UPI002367A0F2|nr:proton-conducting transporter membrane subunit [Rhodopirellula sp. P2]WDQ17537.1 proton-conducting transporter membrane subunit [Rhodopirellula sp. P2]
MSELHFPWIECSILVPLLGVLWLQWRGNGERALRDTVVVCVVTLLLTIGELVDFTMIGAFEAHDHWAFLRWIFPPDVFVIDELSAFQLPLAALIFMVIVLSTLRTKAPRFSLELALISESLVLATFSCRASWALIVLLIASTIPPLLELRRRKRCTRIYCLHMGLFAGLLVVGYGWLTMVDPSSSAVLIPGAFLTAAGLLRSGIFPLHLWMTDLFEKATFGTAILHTTPLVGAYAVMRLVLPIAPSWALQSIAVLSLFTAVYAGAMALVQSDARRMFCFLLLSQSSLILVGLELVTPIGLTGALCLWLSVAMSLTGFGITLRCIEARISRISLNEFHGLYPQMPMLAGFFLLTGLASIGFPATVGFVGMELLIEGAVEVYPLVGTMVVIATAFCGVAVLLAYFRVFTGCENRTVISMRARPAERFAILLLTLLLLGGGLYPQPGIASRYHAAKELTRLRSNASIEDAPAEPAAHGHALAAANISE